MRFTGSKTVEFACRGFVPQTPDAICASIADVDRWSTFSGYGPIPGIARARYERKCETMVGSHIRVENTDGSAHTEVILEWDPARRVTIRMQDFSSPLDRIATHFEEEWNFTPAAGGTMIARRFALHPRSAIGWVALLILARILKAAVTRHLAQMRVEAGR